MIILNIVLLAIRAAINPLRPENFLYINIYRVYFYCTHKFFIIYNLYKLLSLYEPRNLFLKIEKKNL